MEAEISVGAWDEARLQIIMLEQDVKILLASVRSIEFVLEEVLKDVRNHDAALARQRHALNEVFPAE